MSSPRAVAFTIAALLALACKAGSTTPRCEGCNLVLISLDTLRADHVGCYGHERDTMPATCAFFADGIRFERAISQAPWTAPAHASIFTGRLPAVHGVVAGPTPAPLGEKLPTLFGILRERGYATLAVHGGGYLRPALPAASLDVDRVIGLLRQGKTLGVIRAAFDAVAPEQPFFLFVHAYDPHTHYKPRDNHFAARNEELDRRAYDEGVCEFEDLPDGSRRLDPARIPSDPGEWRYYETLYDSEIYEADVVLGRLYDWLRETGRLDRTIVAFTSDHGEEFYDHGSCEHVKTVYDELVHVPLMLRGPGIAARVDARTVPASIGLAPTLLDALGIDPAPFGFDAPSLLDPGLDFGPVLSETRFHYDGRRLALASARDARATILRDGDAAAAYFDVASDPRELAPLAEGDARRSAFAPLAAALDRYASAMAAGAARADGEDAEPAIDCETIEQLRELGYVGPDAERERCP